MILWRWTIWTQILFATSLALSWPLEITTLTAHRVTRAAEAEANGICQRKYIRNSPRDLESLRGCQVIEGSLQISLIRAESSDLYSNISFPELREITGYFLIFHNTNLTTMRNMFPNLAVIRGQELIDSHALLVMSMQEMQEVGLPALTNILRGTVWVVGNPNLCYVNTIDWVKIANISSTDEIIYNNKPQCPDTCPEGCPKSDFGERPLCWSNGICQTVHQITCSQCGGRACSRTRTGECCNKACLGGCSGPGPDQCDVCRNIKYQNVCADECPAGLYEYLQRRCVSKEECLEISSPPIEGGKHGSANLTGKWYTDDKGKNMCVLECPKNTELAPNLTACVRCEGTCRKSCPGRTVDSIEAARELAGCTRITGALKIFIRRGSTSTALSIVNELKQNLDKIEEIDHYLAITYTFSIYSLDFLENLKLIRGISLEEDRYALVVKYNENLMELWNYESPPLRKLIIENKNASVLFHYNPKLCPTIIWNFVNQTGIVRPKDNKIDIGITNGDKALCNKKTLQVDEIIPTNSSVTVRFENFRRNLTLPSHLLNYEIHYKEIVGNKTISKFDDRDPCGYDGWYIAEQAKLKDTDIKSGIGIAGEPAWENDKLIINLKPFTEYALYVKAVVIPDETSVNNNTGAESDIRTFRTLAYTPSKPKTFLLAPENFDSIKISWEPPISPNGIMDKYKIFIKSKEESQTFQDQRNFCISGRSVPKVGGYSGTPSFTELLHAGFSKDPKSKQKTDNNCCSCTGLSPKDKQIKEVLYEDQVFDAVMARVLVAPVTSENEDRSSNEVRKSRKRRSSDQNSASDEIGEDRKHIVFPPPHRPVDDEGFMLISGMKLIDEVAFNASMTKYTHVLKNLSHYTTYQVGIQACRKQDPLIKDNDTRTCSYYVYGTIQTAALPSADEIDPKSISINVTDRNQLHLRWAEPLSPNGLIMAYNIKVSRVNGDNVPDILRCITRKSFLLKDRNYTLDELLHPGNYSVTIQAASLAKNSNFTLDQYFVVEDLDGAFTGFWALVILLPILLTILLASFLIFYYIRSKGLYQYQGSTVTSANPEYLRNVDIPEEWEVSRDKVELIKLIGVGVFGNVYEGYLRDFIPGQSKVVCAVKTIQEDRPSEDKALFLKEAGLMTKLNCHHVIKLLGVISRSQPTYVIMELMTNGDLRDFLKKRRPDPDTGEPHPLQPKLRNILRIAAEIADGMAYLHSKNLVHRDLAARNCMVADDMSVKVGDFGMTKDLIESNYYRKQTVGLLPVRWMAPESLKDGVFTNQSDVWSFGVVLWEMVTLAAQPYQGLGHSQVNEFVLCGRIMEKPENCPPILYNLMVECWQYNERNRPSFFKILDKLTPNLQADFELVSFYHSSDGVEYREKLRSRPVTTQEDVITVRTPLRAVFDSDEESNDYGSDDDHNLLNHVIIDDVGDTSSSPLLKQTPTNSASGSNPQVVKSSLTNGLPLTPLTISGSNASRVQNGNPGTSYTSVTTGPPSLFLNPPLSTNFSPSENTNSNNKNTPTITSAPTSGESNFNSTPSTKISNPVSSARVDSTNTNIGNGPVNLTTTYASIVPRSGQVNNLSDVNSDDTGVDNNSSSKTHSNNVSGDLRKVGNGGINGCVGIKHSPMNENRRNRTTQF